MGREPSFWKISYGQIRENWILPCNKNSVHTPVIFTMGITRFIFPNKFSMAKNPVHFFPHFFHGDNSVHFSQQIYHVSPMVKMREKVNRVTKKNLKIYLVYDSSGGIYRGGVEVWEFPAAAKGDSKGKFFPLTHVLITGGDPFSNFFRGRVGHFTPSRRVSTQRICIHTAYIRRQKFFYASFIRR